MSRIILIEFKNTKSNSYLWYTPYKDKPYVRCINTQWAISNYSLFCKLLSKESELVITGTASLELAMKLNIGDFPLVEIQGGKISYGNVVGKYGRMTHAHGKCKLLAAPTFKQMYSRKYNILYSHYLKKFEKGHKNFLPPYKFNYNFVDTEEDITSMIETMGEARDLGKIVLIAKDLETVQRLDATDKITEEVYTYQACIDLCSITVVYYNESAPAKIPADKFTLITFVFPVRTWEQYLSFQRLCASPYPKVYHNGLYDVKYCIRWRCPVNNYIWDTQYYIQSVCPELKGAYSLTQVHSQYVRYSKYWKDMAKWSDPELLYDPTKYDRYCRYGGLDAHNTAEAALSQILQVEINNLRNYVLRTQFAPMCLKSGMTGMKRNPETHKDKQMKYAVSLKGHADNIVAWAEAGHNQSAKLLPILQGFEAVGKAMGVDDVPEIKSTEAKTIDALKYTHPMFEKFIKSLQTARGAEKWLSTFINFTPFQDYNDSDDYFMWDINPFTTISLRLASNSSSFWCGGNAQNVPKDIREMMVPPSGYVFVSTDAPQSESYTTGYLSDCESMLEVLLDPDIDFHKNTAQIVFKVPYDEVTKDLRTGAKPAGHGFNYGLQGYGLLLSMGVGQARHVREALGFDSTTSLFETCTYVIRQVDEAFPEVRGRWYMEQLNKIIAGARLPCITGFAPVLVDDPLKDKRCLNSYVSLESQHLSGYNNLLGSNKIFLDELKNHPIGVKFILQLHDENIMAFPKDTKIGELNRYLESRCLVSTKHRSGKTMTIPVGEAIIGDTWKDLKEDEVAQVLEDGRRLNQDTPIWKLTPAHYELHKEEIYDTVSL